MPCFVWRRHENMSPCTGNRVTDNYEWIAFMSWSGVRIHDLWISETPLATHSGSQRANHSAMTHPSKRIGTSWTVSHTGHNCKPPMQGGKIHHRAAYTLHWRIDIILYGEDMRTCLRVLPGSRATAHYEPVLHELGRGFESMTCESGCES